MPRLANRRVRRRDGLTISGRVCIQEHDASTGRLLREQRTNNLIVNAGLAFLIDAAKGDTVLRANFFAVGESPTTAAATQTGLISEVFRTQVATSRRPGGSQTQWEVKGFLSSGQANGYTLQEFGLFASPDPNTGPMLCRLIYSPISKNVSTTVTYIWTGTFSASEAP